MDAMPKPSYVNMGKAIDGLRSAHVAIREGVATAAEKHHAEKEAWYAKMERDKALKREARNGTTPL